MTRMTAFCGHCGESLDYVEVNCKCGKSVEPNAASEGISVMQILCRTLGAAIFISGLALALFSSYSYIVFVAPRISSFFLQRSVSNISSLNRGGVITSSLPKNRNVITQLLNASYSSDCWKQYPNDGFSRIVTIKNGAWNNGQSDLNKQAYFGIVDKKILLADLTGDGRHEAVVHIACGLESVTSGYEEIFVIDVSSPGMKLLYRFSPRDWSEDNVDIAWSITHVKVDNEELEISYPLGGSQAQPDWDATAGFRWDGRQFVRVDFEARGEDAGSHAHQTIRQLMPIDEAYRDPSFLAFRKDLLGAVERKDSAFLYQAMSPNFGVGLGSEPNTREEFVKEWNALAPDSKVWDVLEKVLQNGGTFMDFSGKRQFVAPYTFGEWPKDVDSFACCVVMSPSSFLQSEPVEGSILIGKLSYDVVNVDSGGCTQGQEWTRVSTGTGVNGFIETKYLRSPIDYRAAFEKVGSKWEMVSLITGD